MARRAHARYYPALIERGFVDAGGRPLASAFTGGSSRGGYNAGSMSRRLAGWTPALSGPNQAYWGDLARLISRSRDAVRNNGYAVKAVHSFVSNAVGTGIIPRWRRLRTHLVGRLGMTEEAAAGVVADLIAVWDDWVTASDADGRLSFYGLQALAIRTMFASGESLARIRTRRLDDDLPVPLQIQLLEPDYLDSSQHGDVVEGNRRSVRRMGIEFDRLGRRRAYWLHPRHPGDDVWTGIQTESRRVPAADVVHLYRLDRPGQVRGIPWLTPVLASLHALNEYEDATLVGQKIQALFAAFVTRDPVSGHMPSGFSGEEPGEEPELPALEPGLVSELPEGADIKFAEPQGVPGTFEPYIGHQLRRFAAGIPITYEQLSGDLRGVNYSSIRAGLVEFRRWCQAFQYLTLIDQFCKPIMDAWLRHVFAAGIAELPGYAENPRPYHQVEWIPPGWDWVDPEKDIKAKALAVKSGFETRTGIIAELGYDREDIDAERAEELEDARRLGLPDPGFGDENDAA